MAAALPRSLAAAAAAAAAALAAAIVEATEVAATATPPVASPRGGKPCFAPLTFRSGSLDNPEWMGCTTPSEHCDFLFPVSKLPLWILHSPFDHRRFESAGIDLPSIESLSRQRRSSHAIDSVASCVDFEGLISLSSLHGKRPLKDTPDSSEMPSHRKEKGGRLLRRGSA